MRDEQKTKYAVLDVFGRQLSRLAGHARWADEQLINAFKAMSDFHEGRPGIDASISDAIREEAHVIGALETWLSRLQGRDARCEVWPTVDIPALEGLAGQTHKDLEGYVTSLGAEDALTTVAYVNSAGRSFTNSVGDILTHAFLHAQYHRGKVNILLRKANLQPAPVDYIAFVRGARAATEADAAVRRAKS